MMFFSDYVNRDKIPHLISKFDEIETHGDLERFYKSLPVEDAHLQVGVKCKCGKFHLYINNIEFVSPDQYFYSNEPIDIIKFISASNTEYVRFILFDDFLKYSEVFNRIKLNKDFLILDLRTN